MRDKRRRWSHCVVFVVNFEHFLQPLSSVSIVDFE